ncbi:MAG: [FeFe] hydrogenase H-cluster maturation GTPase HydF [Bacteroidales bacterium]|jgi:[FeFe] hydrogenase H-cluster maturation GTPase HydF|nr:[FeFe] hydrogenase H-cluster maturation GTPase HydF [Bacteroidales bacterium]HNY43901.1 [FeFe] hydrogenase H-cluster maturation GTPase HydF [Bacteroidales bacterium]HOD89067.1 [FeFe] hydrogenase H-cluster maturation GTPase HydF [Bacteroidales bacterium]
MALGKENKIHIGIYGRRNVGKSALINFLSGQNISIVADLPGTTTDPVKRSFEITGFGPAIFIDTAGIDDAGEIGDLRTKKTLDTTDKVDLAILVFDSNTFGKYEESLINNFNNAKLPYILLHSKSDIQSLNTDLEQKLKNNFTKNIIDFSIKDLTKRDEFFELIKSTIPDLSLKTDTLLGDIIKKGDLILLVSTIDAGTPAGRLILPQVQTIRDVLDNDAISIILKQDEIKDFLEKSKVKPNLVITDSQIFDTVSKLIDKSILLTSFSIVLARQKGDFQAYIEGTPHIENLKDGDNILILESCSHHVSCDDIGRKKIPTLLRNYTKKELNFTVVSGLDNIPEAIQNYALVIQCGGCVLTKKQVQNRLKPAVDAKIPVTNYGMLIAYVHGIFERAVQVFKK